MYTKPPVKKDEKNDVRLVGNFLFSVDPEVIDFIAREAYDKDQGATSLKDFIIDEIENEFNALHTIEGKNGRTSD